jgi:hypothetical protein
MNADALQAGATALLGLGVTLGALVMVASPLEWALWRWATERARVERIAARLEAYTRTGEAVVGRRSDDGYTAYTSVDDRKAA